MNFFEFNIAGFFFDGAKIATFLHSTKIFLLVYVSFRLRTCSKMEILLNVT